jgi:hypothetical protein
LFHHFRIVTLSKIERVFVWFGDGFSFPRPATFAFLTWIPAKAVCLKRSTNRSSARRRHLEGFLAVDKFGDAAQFRDMTSSDRDGTFLSPKSILPLFLCLFAMVSGCAQTENYQQSVESNSGEAYPVTINPIL